MDATHEFDIVSPAFHSDPFPTLDRMRAEGPVVRIKVPILGRMRFAVTYDACATLLKDHESFARDPANAGSRTQARILRFLPSTIGLLALNMIGKDDPEHRRLRDRPVRCRWLVRLARFPVAPRPTSALKATAIGQLLDYRQRLVEAARMLVVLGARPKHVDQELATSNGFGRRTQDTSFSVFWPQVSGGRYPELRQRRLATVPDRTHCEQVFDAASCSSPLAQLSSLPRPRAIVHVDLRPEWQDIRAALLALIEPQAATV
jgi:hypothetical protein